MKFFFLFFCCCIFHFAFSQTPSLIPLPRQIKWGKDFFSLNLCKAIVAKDSSVQTEVAYLQNELKGKGNFIPAKQTIRSNQPSIEINICNDATLVSDEAYHLSVNAKKDPSFSKNNSWNFQWHSNTAAVNSE